MPSKPMTVADLINKLRQFDPDLPVCIAQPAHDYWHTMVASQVHEVNEETVKRETSRDVWIMPREDAKEPDPEDTPRQTKCCVVISN